ncbi:hypothetical protein SRB5_54530 [Streptomyces sp. RB5]|uniref:Activator of Hsp90 ATPase homologue 1/2-like C-terminal domain-containing protein n=1 Tax=Streptomyces smaragdinus TaxID=2585196 RepID=A0A7K0CR96_9ACTN|nr:SRPBCC domain-containing protein [Streptomyces smaragdinus]MQY15274.1 hypothetical protein [Streptomyces smaragdinus]
MSYDYTLTRVLEAPVERVWQAWTVPGQYEQWANAVPGSVSLDVRPGGTWAATMLTPDGSAFPLTGSYAGVEENERLVVGMDTPGGQSLMDCTFRAVDGGTEFTVSQSCDTEEERDMAKQGSGMLLDGLTAFLAK